MKLKITDEELLKAYSESTTKAEFVEKSGLKQPMGRIKLLQKKLGISLKPLERATRTNKMDVEGLTELANKLNIVVTDTVK